jgi:hypothetical protein
MAAGRRHDVLAWNRGAPQRARRLYVREVYLWRYQCGKRQSLTIAADDGQLSTSTTGGVNVTAASISLPPGTWSIHGVLQTLRGTGGSLLQSGCVITGDGGAAGLLNATDDANFRPGADQQTYNPGTSMDHRLKCFDVVQLTTTTTIYLRAYMNFSGAGSLTYRGFITAMLIS